jgi:hypothetical protein
MHIESQRLAGGEVYWTYSKIRIVLKDIQQLAALFYVLTLWNSLTAPLVYRAPAQTLYAELRARAWGGVRRSRTRAFAA